MNRFQKIKQKNQKKILQKQIDETQKKLVQGALSLIGILMALTFIFGDHGLLQLYKLKKELPTGRGGEFKRVRKAVDFIESFPLSSQYVLSCMSSSGFDEAMRFANWESYNPDRANKQLTKKELEEIQKRFPKDENGSRNYRKENKEEVLEMNPLIENNLIKELVSMIQRINPQKINDHENLKLKLEAIKRELIVVLDE